MRILLVEDEPALQELWADVLRERGYVVDLASTLMDAQDCFATQVYDLVIDPPPAKWSGLSYGFCSKEDRDAEESLQAGGDRREAAAG
jgi:hypothetical protein